MFLNLLAGLSLESTILLFAFFSFSFIAGCVAQDNDTAVPSNRIADFIAQQKAAGKKPNRLIHEHSPYLLQHAFNPVDWYAWGEEAFAAARETGKPIFLSIGYATCHWCHVMEHESFENEEIAQFLNENFIAIKVDREERPDVDAVYMAATQAMTGSGGWPMTIFLTHDLKPFYCGTYYPPEARYGKPGFRQLLEGILKVWQNDREKILDSARQLTTALQAQAPAGGYSLLNTQLLDQTYQQFSQSFDAENGGFGRAPKFPRPVSFNFLFRYAQRTGEKNARQMAMVTLRKMAKGGMRDHVGGGFHRYSVDSQWRVSHFEKMLYDQAQLAVSYLEAYQISGSEFFADVARDIFAYVQRDMTDAAGGFYSAEDADSPLPENPREKAEGAFYLWEKSEIENILGKKDASFFCDHYGIVENGNTISDPQGEFGSKNVLYLAQSQAAGQSGRLRAMREKLLAVRAKRPRPLLDDKIITAWNGLMISAFAKGYQILRDPQYLQVAENAANYLKSKHFDEDRQILLRRSRNGEAGLAAHLEDYAFLVQGLTDLYDASFDIKWLKWAIDLTENQMDLFTDPQGGFFDTSGQDESIIVRMKELYDGAEPSGNAIAVLNLLRLAEMTGREDWRQFAELALKNMAPTVEQHPSAYPQMMVALNFISSQIQQVIFAAIDSNDPGLAQMQNILAHNFNGNRIQLFADSGEAQKFLSRQLPFLQAIAPIDGKATVYLCENFVCKMPTNNPEEFERQLKETTLAED